MLQAPVDLALLLFGTLKDLHSNADLTACFQCAARALAPGGLLVVEMEALTTLTDGEWLAPDAWDFELDGQEHTVEFGTEHDEYDPVSQVGNSAVVQPCPRWATARLCRVRLPAPHRLS